MKLTTIWGNQTIASLQSYVNRFPAVAGAIAVNHNGVCYTMWRVNGIYYVSTVNGDLFRLVGQLPEYLHNGLSEIRGWRDNGTRPYYAPVTDAVRAVLN